MLSLITKAKAVFATEASRQEYDKQLEISQRGEVIPDPMKERLESFHQWKERAKNYSLDKQYDLAKVAIEKAISFNDNNDEDIEFLSSPKCGVNCLRQRYSPQGAGAESRDSTLAAKRPGSP